MLGFNLLETTAGHEILNIGIEKGVKQGIEKGVKQGSKQGLCKEARKMVTES